MPLRRHALASRWLAVAAVLRLSLVSLVPTLLCGAARAELDNNGGIWLMGVGQGTLERLHLERVRWWLDAQVRFRGDSDGFDQAIVRPALGFAIHEQVSLWAGYAWIRTSPATGRNSHEHRAWQQLLWLPPLEIVSLQSRTRLEQRFLSTGDDAGWRIRQLAKVAYPLPFEPRLSLVGSDELFFDLNDTDWGQRAGFDQNRFFAGFAWRFDAGGRVIAELGYLNQFIDSRSGSNPMNHLASLNFFFK